MSRTWSLKTNSQLGLDEVSAWLTDSGSWNEATISQEHQRLVTTSPDSSLTLIGVDHMKKRPGLANIVDDSLGCPSTLIFLLQLSRKVDHCGRLDEIFDFAFRFASLDESCNLYFKLEDCGIFKRIDGQYVVNPDQFFAKSLASFLTFPYVLAGSSTRTELTVSQE